MIHYLTQINVRSSNVLIAFAASLTVQLKVAVVTEWLLLLHSELLADKLTVTDRAGEAFPVVDLIL